MAPATLAALRRGLLDALHSKGLGTTFLAIAAGQVCTFLGMGYWETIEVTVLVAVGLSALVRD
jgi:hypothetical protein